MSSQETEPAAQYFAIATSSNLAAQDLPAQDEAQDLEAQEAAPLVEHYTIATSILAANMLPPSAQEDLEAQEAAPLVEHYTIATGILAPDMLPQFGTPGPAAQEAAPMVQHYTIGSAQTIGCDALPPIQESYFETHDSGDAKHVDAAPPKHSAFGMVHADDIMCSSRKGPTSTSGDDKPRSVVVYDEMTYRPDSLLGWNVLTSPHKSIWSSWSLWATMGRLAIVSILVGLVAVLTIPDPAALRVEIFLKISSFLTIFCGLMLGFFMTSSVKRWHECARGFLELCDSVRNLQMQLQALGVTEARCNLCIRYGLISGWLLKSHLESEHKANGEVPHGTVSARGNKGNILEDLAVDSDHVELGIEPKLLPCEVAVLLEMKDPAAAIWTWISSLLGRMAQEGEIPAMQSPTYGRIMNLASDAHKGIRNVRSSISVRMPFVYVQMLTSLVHVNNILNAISLGLVMGVAVSGWLIRRDLHFYHPKVRENQHNRDVQFFFVTSLCCIVGPLLYQALTEISVSLAQPFETQIGKIPIARLLISLEQELDEGSAMSGACPRWERPAFHVPKAV